MAHTMNKLQCLQDPKATDVANCHWAPGQNFRVAKVDRIDLHSAWYVVQPGGGMLTFNDCADDAWDEARANWVADALNDRLAAATQARANEPVAYAMEGLHSFVSASSKSADAQYTRFYTVPLYTSPQPSHEPAAQPAANKETK